MKNLKKRLWTNTSQITGKMLGIYVIGRQILFVIVTHLKTHIAFPNCHVILMTRNACFLRLRQSNHVMKRKILFAIQLNTLKNSLFKHHVTRRILVVLSIKRQSKPKQQNLRFIFVIRQIQILNAISLLNQRRLVHKQSILTRQQTLASFQKSTLAPFKNYLTFRC